jgi:hypothetical protein
MAGLTRAGADFLLVHEMFNGLPQHSKWLPSQAIAL